MNWYRFERAGEVACLLKEPPAMVAPLTPAAESSPVVEQNIEYAFGARKCRICLIPVAISDIEHFPTSEVPCIVRRMPRFELDDTELDEITRSPIIYENHTKFTNSK
ncbi:MAG: hypothetical protein OXQ89_05680 [Rhodospirillaceae bacterium]|nr:hypothetical protein [Rhodospirillaceae bacterium]